METESVRARIFEDLLEEAIEEATRDTTGNSFRCAGCGAVQPLTRTPAGSLRDTDNFRLRIERYVFGLVCLSCDGDRAA